MDKQQVRFTDLGIIEYKSAWDYQEELVSSNRQIKSVNLNANRYRMEASGCEGYPVGTTNYKSETTNHLLFCEHPSVYTLGKSGSIKNLLLSEKEMEEKEIEFVKTNRGGDITFHGSQQVVGYPILDLENFYTDIGRYLRELEEVIIKTIADYGIKGERSKGETGVWIDPGIAGRERKICAMGIRCSRWITMHGFALNVNTDLRYFENIIPCGIPLKQVTSLEKELSLKIPLQEVKDKLKRYFSEIFNVEII